MKAKTRVTRCSLGVLLALAAAGFVGCAAEDDGRTAGGAAGFASSAPGSPSPKVPVVQPGGPGDPTASGVAVQQRLRAPWNTADEMFVQMMVPHHAQALEISALAGTRAQHPRVRALAERIGAAQLPEIELMTSWLQEQGVAPMDAMDGMEGMGVTAPMQGMLSPAQMDELAEAQGSRFDRLFLRGMITHHQGAVAMADEVAVDGAALQVRELAADVAGSQAAEVGRMRDLLRAR